MREIAFAHSVLDEQYGLRQPLRSLFTELRAAVPCEETGPARASLLGGGRYPRSPELAARCMSVLSELGVAAIEAESGFRRLGAVSSNQTDLGRSASFRAGSARREEGKRYLEGLERSLEGPEPRETAAPATAVRARAGGGDDPSEPKRRR